MSTLSDIRIGVVTFGESGAAQVTADLETCLPGHTIDEIGLLDGVAPTDLDGWSAGDGCLEATVVHQRDGTELTLRSSPLMARIPATIAALGDAQPAAILYGCAGPLPDLVAPCQTLHPFALLKAFLDGVLPAGRVGIVVPSPLHVSATVANYSTTGRAVECRAAAPSDELAVAAALASVSANGADLLVLACFDHTLGELETARCQAPCPVISSRGVAIAALVTLFGTTPMPHGALPAPRPAPRWKPPGG